MPKKNGYWHKGKRRKEFWGINLTCVCDFISFYPIIIWYLNL